MDWSDFWYVKKVNYMSISYLKMIKPKTKPTYSFRNIKRDKTERFLKLISRDSNILVWLRNEHPLLHPPTLTIHKDSENQLWSRGNEIYRSGIWGWDQRTWREGRSTHRVSIWVWTWDVETCSWSQEWFEREGLMGEREKRQSFLRPLFWGLKTQMQNSDLSLINEVMSSMFPSTRHSF